MAVYHAKTKIVRIAVQRIACGPLVAAAPAYRAEVRWSTAVGKRMSRRSAKWSVIDNKMYNTTEKSPCVADTQGDPVLFLEADHVIGRTAHDAAELFQRDHGDVAALFQSVQRLVIHAALQQLVLGDATALSRKPCRRFF